MDEPAYEDFLKKEETKDKWVEYWVVLRNCVLYFYNEQADVRDKYWDKIEITANARCSIVKRRMYSYRFELVTKKGSWLLKCPTILQRDRWMNAIEVAVQKISFGAAELAPVATVQTEQDLCGGSVRRKKQQQLETSRENNNNTLEELSLKLNWEEGGRRDRQNSKKSFKLMKNDQKEIHTSDQDLGNLVENLAFYEEEVDDKKRRLKFKLSGDGNAWRRSIRSEPGAAKLIRVGSTCDD